MRTQLPIFYEEKIVLLTQFMLNMNKPQVLMTLKIITDNFFSPIFIYKKTLDPLEVKLEDERTRQISSN